MPAKGSSPEIIEAAPIQLFQAVGPHMAGQGPEDVRDPGVEALRLHEPGMAGFAEDRGAVPSARPSIGCLGRVFPGGMPDWKQPGPA